MLLFLTQLPQDLFELGAGFRELANRLVLVPHSLLAFEPLELLFGLSHGAAGRFDLVAAGGLLGLSLFLRLLALGRRSLLRLALFALFAGLGLLTFALLFVGFPFLGIAFLRVAFFGVALFL